MARRERTYYDHRSPRKKPGKKRTGRAIKIVDGVMLAVSGAVALAVALSWASRWIPPSAYGIMSAAGLLMPVLMAVNFVCLLYWVFRWRRGALIPLAVFVVWLFGVNLFFRPQFTKSYADLSRDRSLVDIVTYNVQGMMRGDGAGGMRSTMDEVVAVVDSLHPDIVCMQEFQTTRDYPAGRFGEALPQLQYRTVRYNIAGGEPGFGWGNAIYSRYPIVGSGHIDFSGTNNGVVWADIVIARDTLRVFNAHLQTTSIKADDERYIVGGDFVGDSTRTSKMRRMARSLTLGNIVRASQADTLASRIASSPHAVVVCGDFNDTPVSYSYRRISRRLRDSFREAGHGYGYTYRGFFNTLRIDYVLHSRSMECVRYTSPSFATSDHNPVAVKIKMNP